VTTLIDDPLIAAMTIDRMLPLHESSQRLRQLYPQCPRVYGVAVVADVSVRRWWPLESALTTDRLQDMFAAAAVDMDRRSAARQLAATLVHTVIGRVVALVVLEARAWDTGLENLWVHVDSDGVIDWAGVVDPTVRALPGDPYFAEDDGDCVRDGVVRLPSEAALTTCGSPTVVTAPWNRCSPNCTRSAAARFRWRRCGTSSARWWWPRRPRCRSWPASTRWPRCAAVKQCSTRWSASACRSAAP
jgi:hypothetical protein